MGHEAVVEAFSDTRRSTRTDWTGYAWRATDEPTVYANGDGLLPPQWWLPRHPELALLWAVLEDALVCVHIDPQVNDAGWHYAPRTRAFRARLHAEALAWICSERRDYLFAFREVCDMLTIDAEAVRAYVWTGARYRPSRAHTLRGVTRLRLVGAA